MKPATALLVALAIFAGRRGKGAALDPKGGISLDNVSAADWGKLASAVHNPCENPPFPPALTKLGNVGEAGEIFLQIGKYITHFFGLLFCEEKKSAFCFI